MSQISHIAIIMDGNRRWAKAKQLSVDSGHAEGVEALEKVVRSCSQRGIKFLTVYALSTENLEQRSKNEIGSLFSLIQKGIVEKLPVLKKEGVSVKFFGDLAGLPLTTRQAVKFAEKSLANGNSLQLNIALNYGGRDEIVRAIGKLVKSGKNPSEEALNNELDTAGIPDPELLIRTGGAKRLSNFLLWQSGYSELYFTDVLWPDFNEKELDEAINEFEKRKRNFGA